MFKADIFDEKSKKKKKANNVLIGNRWNNGVINLI